MDLFRERHANAVSVIISGSAGGRPGIFVAVTDDLVAKGYNAGVIAQAIASATGAKGGGRPHFASGGVGPATSVEHLVTQIPSLVSSAIAR
jgi:alanyl-tRNA synthetase